MQAGEHAGVRTPEITEVVVRRMLAAEDGSGLGHQPLDIGVADSRTQCRSAALGDHFGNHP